MTRRKTPFQTQYNLRVPSAKYLGVTISEDLKWTDHIDSITKKANQTLGFLKRNIRVHNQNLKATAYKTLVRSQLEYASTVWSPYTAVDTYKLESAQRRAARWVTRDYRYTSSVTAMLQDLSWRPLDQRRIGSRLVLLYKVTYDLVAIPSGDYLIRNTRSSAKNHPLAYRQITTLKDYYKFTFLPPDHHPLERPTSPYTRPPSPCTVQYSCLPGFPYNTLNASICFYLLTILYKLISPTFLLLLHMVYQNPSEVLFGG